MTRRYQELCSITSDSTPKVESLERPYKDWAQEAWHDALSGLHRHGPLPQAESSDELKDNYRSHAGLVVTCHNQAIYDDHRARKGNKHTPKKSALLERMFSLDDLDESGVEWSQLIEDLQAEIPFRQVEASDLLEKDERMKNLTKEQKQAVKRFVLAWSLQDAGYKLPKAVVVRVSRDRKKHGLPLELKRGRS